MSIAVNLPKSLEDRVRQKAAESGLSIDEFVREVLQRETDPLRPSFDELAGPISAAQNQSDLDDDAAKEPFQNITDQVRAERRRSLQKAP